MFLKKLISTHLKRWLLPPICLLCENFLQSREAICKSCKNDLPILPKHCLQCAQTLSSPNEMILTCGTCLKKPPPFDKIFALFPYEPPITQFITLLKFHGNFKYASLFAEYLIQKIQTEWYQDHSLPHLILPVPLHTKRLKERGFNQALEIAKPIAKALSLPIDQHGVKRIRETKAQSGLSSDARKKNIAHAFQACQDYSNLIIALIDDVITTTSTVTEISRVLQKQGAQSIHVWCCARSMNWLKSDN